MAKKKSTKRSPTRKQSTKKTARTGKRSAKGKPAASAKKPTAAKKATKRVKSVSKKTAKKGVKKPAPAKAAAKAKVATKSASQAAPPRKTVAKRMIGPKKAAGNETVSASKKPAVHAAKAPAASSPIYGSSVIRIKMNNHSKRHPPKNRKSKETQSPEATALDPIQYPEQSRRQTKTYLTAKELREFKAILLRKRSELCGDVEQLTSEAFYKGGGGNDRSNMPIHMADLGTDNWEQDFTIDLIDNERSRVVEIDEALRRIEKKTYGICVATQNKISLARLRAKPWAKYCIEFARAREEGRAY